jgi:hypothetical protein
MPIGAPSHRPEPKSGCMVASAPIAATNAADLGCTGSPDTSARQTLSAGNPVQSPRGPGFGEGVGVGPRPSPSTPDGPGVADAAGVADAVGAAVGAAVADGSSAPHAARATVSARASSDAGVRRTGACYPRKASSTPGSRGPRKTGSRRLTTS